MVGGKITLKINDLFIWLNTYSLKLETKTNKIILISVIGIFIIIMDRLLTKI